MPMPEDIEIFKVPIQRADPFHLKRQLKDHLVHAKIRMLFLKSSFSESLQSRFFLINLDFQFRHPVSESTKISNAIFQV